jgi:hypothetical protein
MYTPGHMVDEKFNLVFEKESSKYRDLADPEDEIVFMRVLTRKHLNFCMNKMFPGR